MFRRLSLFLVLLLAVAAPLSAQTITATTAAAALSASGTSLRVASATGFTVGNLVAIDREFMTILSVTGTTIRVGERGSNGTAATPHVSGSIVYTGTPAAFKGWDLAGAATFRAQFDIDNGAATTLDFVRLEQRDLVLTGCRLIYEQTAGTVAAANIRAGTTAGGTDVIASTAYTNAATSGTVVPLTLAKFIIPAGTTLFVRHTGIASPVAGVASIECTWNFR